jgi:CheY-like chemotaxis protein
MRVLYVSGDYRDAAVGVAPEHFLAKPFSLEVLVERVQQALGGR